MSSSTVTNWLDALEGVTPTAFLLGAVLFVLAMAVAIAFVEPGVVTEFWLELLFVAIFVSVAIGLGGFHATVSPGSERLAGLGALGAVITGVFALLILGMVVAMNTFGWAPGAFEPLAWTGALVGIVIGFLAFGAAIWRTAVVRRVIGGLLVAGGIFLVAYIGNLLLWQHEGVAMVFRLLWGLSLIGVAYSLRTESVPAEQADIEIPREPT